jgi:hypothetical protein
MRSLRGCLALGTLAAGLAAGAQQEDGGHEAPPEVAAKVDAWLRSDHRDANLREAAIEAVLRTADRALPWFGRRIRSLPPDAEGSQQRAMHSLASGVVLGFIEAQRRSGIVYRGQYLPLRELQPFAASALFEWLLKTPDWMADTRRVEFVAPLADLQRDPPPPPILLGITDLIENEEIEPENLRLGLSCLVWQWGRRSYVEEAAAALRAASGEGDAEDRILALRQLADLWYRVQEHRRAASSHAAMTAMAVNAKLPLSPTDWYWGACYAALCGRLDDGLQALERCAELQASDSVDSSTKLPRSLFEKDPEIALLRADPRFAAVLERAFPAQAGKDR